MRKKMSKKLMRKKFRKLLQSMRSHKINLTSTRRSTIKITRDTLMTLNMIKAPSQEDGTNTITLWKKSPIG